LNAAQAIVTKLIAGGMDPVEAASLLAHAVIEMTVPAGGKSSAAIRQQRYRERNKSVTKRNESVTEHNGVERNETVTNRNETVTPLRPGNSPISYLLPSSSNSLSEKKESKKERQPRKRNAPLPDDWAPSLRAFQLAEQCGQNVQIVEGIFRDYLKSSGKLYADYDAAFNNFIRNQQRFNGKNGTATSKSGSLVESINRELEALKQSEGTHFELPEGRIRLISS
jgi:hypothetical protein